MFKNFWDIEGLITTDFRKNHATLNSASYCRLLRQYFTVFIKMFYDIT